MPSAARHSTGACHSTFPCSSITKMRASRTIAHRAANDSLPTRLRDVLQAVYGSYRPAMLQCGKYLIVCDLGFLLRCSTPPRLADDDRIRYLWRPAVPPRRDPSLRADGVRCRTAETVSGQVPFPMGNGQAPGIATGRGVSGVGGAAAVLAAEVLRAGFRLGAAGFFLAAFFLADFSVGFFLPVLPRAPVRARVFLAALVRFLEAELPRFADLRAPALPAFGRAGFFLFADFPAAFPVRFRAAAFLALAI